MDGKYSTANTLANVLLNILVSRGVNCVRWGSASSNKPWICSVNFIKNSYIAISVEAHVVRPYALNIMETLRITLICSFESVTFHEFYKKHLLVNWEASQNLRQHSLARTTEQNKYLRNIAYRMQCAEPPSRIDIALQPRGGSGGTGQLGASEKAPEGGFGGQGRN
jgi:hypothetical protein